MVGLGKFQLLAKYGTSTQKVVGPDIDWDTLELNVNYIIKDQSARIQLFYIDKSFNRVLTDSADTVRCSVRLMTAMLPSITINQRACHIAANDPALLATDLVD